MTNSNIVNNAIAAASASQEDEQVAPRPKFNFQGTRSLAHDTTPATIDNALIARCIANDETAVAELITICKSLVAKGTSTTKGFILNGRAGAVARLNMKMLAVINRNKAEVATTPKMWSQFKRHNINTETWLGTLSLIDLMDACTERPSGFAAISKQVANYARPYITKDGWRLDITTESGEIQVFLSAEKLFDLIGAANDGSLQDVPYNGKTCTMNRSSNFDGYTMVIGSTKDASKCLEFIVGNDPFVFPCLRLTMGVDQYIALVLSQVVGRELGEPDADQIRYSRVLEEAFGDNKHLVANSCEDKFFKGRLAIDKNPKWNHYGQYTDTATGEIRNSLLYGYTPAMMESYELFAAQFEKLALEGVARKEAREAAVANGVGEQSPRQSQPAVKPYSYLDDDEGKLSSDELDEINAKPF